MKQIVAPGSSARTQNICVFTQKLTQNRQFFPCYVVFCSAIKKEIQEEELMVIQLKDNNSMITNNDTKGRNLVLQCLFVVNASDYSGVVPGEFKQDLAELNATFF